MKASSLSVPDEARVQKYMKTHKVSWNQACKALGLVPEKKKGGRKPKMGLAKASH